MTRKPRGRVLTTTLREIRAAGPCRKGWVKLIKALGGIDIYGLDTPLPVARVLESNGEVDTKWVLDNMREVHHNNTHKISTCLSCQFDNARTVAAQRAFLNNCPIKAKPAEGGRE